MVLYKYFFIVNLLEEHETLKVNNMLFFVFVCGPFIFKPILMIFSYTLLIQFFYVVTQLIFLWF